MTTTVDTALITPLAAYLDLRTRGRAAFLLESVDQGRLGRYSLVGCGDRLVTIDEAERLAEPVVGYLAYDHVTRLEPTVPMPDPGAGLPESRFVVADVLLRFDHLLGTAEVLAGPPDLGIESGRPLPQGRGERRPGTTQRFPAQAEYESGVER